MPSNRRQSFVRVLGYFQYDYMHDSSIRRIEMTTVRRDRGGWTYALKVFVDPGKGGHLPQLYCGYSVIVVEESED